MALTKNRPRTGGAGDIYGLAVKAATTVYEGAYIGLSAGYARGLVAGDKFGGVAERKADNASGAAGAINVIAKKRGYIQDAISGLLITDIGAPVYASADDTLTLTPFGTSFVGFVEEFVSAGVGLIRFDVDAIDPFGGNDNREEISADKTLDAEDTGKIFFVTADAKIITLPATATAGQRIRIVNGGSAGTIAINVSPAAADKIMGPDLAGVDNKDLINTKATAIRGDFVELVAGHADGWTVSDMRGVWAAEA